MRATKDPKFDAARITTPKVQDLARLLCDKEHRNLSNLVEAALLEYGRNRGVDANQLDLDLMMPVSKAA